MGLRSLSIVTRVTPRAADQRVSTTAKRNKFFFKKKIQLQITLVYGVIIYYIKFLLFFIFF